MRIAALGRTHWLHDSIRAVAEAGHEVVLIATAPAAPEYRVTERDFERLAGSIGCDFLVAKSLDSEKELARLRAVKADVAISVNWPTVIGSGARSSFRHGIVNAHAGDLPRFRGNACPNWAILSGEDKIVLTLHKMASGIDDGPVLLKWPFPLRPEKTYIGEVYEFLTSAIPQAFRQVITGLEDGSIVGAEQPEEATESLRCFPRLPVDGEIDWTASAADISRLVRASAEPFDGAYTFLGDQKLTIWRANASAVGYPYLGVPGQVIGVNSESGRIKVLSGKDALEIEVVSLGNGRQSAASVVRSTRIRLGLVPSERIAALERKLELLEMKIASVLRDPQS